MTPRVITAQADDTIDRLAKIMYDKKIHRVIILDKEQVIGVVSTLDILHAVSTMGYGTVPLLWKRRLWICRNDWKLQKSLSSPYAISWIAFVVRSEM